MKNLSAEAIFKVGKESDKKKLKKRFDDILETRTTTHKRQNIITNGDCCFNHIIGTKHNYFAIIGTALFVALIALATVTGTFNTTPTSAMTMQKGNQTMSKNMTSAGGGMMTTGNMTPPNKR